MKKSSGICPGEGITDIENQDKKSHRLRAVADVY